MFVKCVRQGLGRIIAGVSMLTQGKPMLRSQAEQATVNAACEKLALYQFYACPFCIKVRRRLHQLNLPIETRDAQNNQEFRNELQQEGGRIKVPCLRIQKEDSVQWLYESDDIIAYLETTFAQ